MKQLLFVMTCLVPGLDPGSLIGAEIQLKEEKRVKGLCISPDFAQFVTVERKGRDDSVAHFRDLMTEKVVKTIKLDSGWGAPRLLSPDGKTWVALRETTPGNSNTKAMVYRLSDGEGIAHLAWAQNLVYSPDGKTLAFHGYPKPPADVNEWVSDIETGKHTKQQKTYGHRGFRFAFSPDAKIVATLYEVIGEIMVSLNDTVTGKQLAEFKTHGDRQKYGAFVTDVAFSPDGKKIATASADRTVRLWGIEPKLWPELRAKKDRFNTTIPGGKEALNLDHLDEVLAIAFHPKGNVLASLSKDKKLRLWDLDTRQVLATTALAEVSHYNEEPIKLQFSPDGKRLACWKMQQITIWEVRGILPEPSPGR